jgi:metallo-beta-lactamase family protein
MSKDAHEGGGARSELICYGGVGMATGANFMLKTDTSVILFDCGLIQGSDEEEMKNWSPFAYDPSRVDMLFVSHAHADHIGRIPKLVRDGFSGVIYSTDATRDLARIMFDDALTLARFEKEREGRDHFYDERDVESALGLWKTIDYHSETRLNDETKVMFRDAGHVLGSAIITLTREREGRQRSFSFTGDLGNSPTPLLRPTEHILDSNYILMESVYGDRNHDSVEQRGNKLKRIVQGALRRGGALIIPAFSIERTQIMLYELNELIESGELPRVPVFLDSPLAERVTEVYKKYAHYFNEKVQKDIAQGDSIFDFPGLRISETREESKRIFDEPNPKIIIAGSGMSEGGRIQYHQKAYLSDPSCTLLIVGYQPVGGFGHALLHGAKKVRILGEQITVRAKIESIMSYSAHMQLSDLQVFVEKASEGSALERVFVAMGEPKASLFLVQRLRDYFGVDAVAPAECEVVPIDF